MIDFDPKDPFKYHGPTFNKWYDDKKDRLRDLLKTHCVKHGKFTLRSGKESDFYINCRPVLIGEYKLISDVFGLFCWEMGAMTAASTGMGIHIAAAFGHSYGSVIHVRGAKKDHGVGGKVELSYKFKELPPINQQVVVVDDVLTTGSSLAFCLDALKEENIPAHVCVVLVDREEGGKETIENDYGLLVFSIFKKSDLIP